MDVHAPPRSELREPPLDRLLQNRSIVELWGWDRSSCGYCNTAKSSRVFGVWAHQLHPQDYFLLINRGWRRSGKFLYRPDNFTSCCQQLTIRMEAAYFKPSKSQRKAMRRFHRYMQPLGRSPPRTSSVMSEGKAHENGNVAKRPRHVRSTMNRIQVDDNTKQLLHSLIRQALLSLDKSELAIPVPVVLESIPFDFEFRHVISSSSFDGERKRRKPPTTANVTTNISFTLAAAERLYWSASGPSDTSAERQMFLSHAIVGWLRRLSQPNLIRHVESAYPGFINIWTDPLPPTSPCTSQEEDGLHDRSPSLLPYVRNPSTCATSQRRNLQIDFVRPTFELDAFELYQRYQWAIHTSPASDNSQRSYRKFLVESPLVTSGQYGSYHMRYVIDGKLVAVGVVDLLPGCLSSVYFFYEPDLKHLSLGAVSVFKEIEWMRTIGEKCWGLGLKWYYMGYAIQGCQKMEYKFRFRPTFVLDDREWEWVPVEAVLAKFGGQGGRLDCVNWAKSTAFHEGEDLDSTSVGDDLILSDDREIIKFEHLASKMRGKYDRAVEKAMSLLVTWAMLIGREDGSRFLHASLL